MAEIVLTQIDRALQQRFNYQRYIDDYTCYTQTRDEAQDFLNTLERELAKYSLYLNFKKTAILHLPAPEIPVWIDDLRINTVLHDENNFYEIKLFLSRALDVAEKNPDGSVLKFALHSICDCSFTASNGEYVLRRVLGLAQAHPHLVPCLYQLLKYGYAANGRFRFKNELRSVLRSAATSRRSDAMCWTLQLCSDTSTTIETDLEDTVLKTYDTMAIIMLYRAGSTRVRRNITRFVRRLVLPRPQSVIEHHWMLIHYLLNERRLFINEVADPSLRVLRQRAINLYG